MRIIQLCLMHNRFCVKILCSSFIFLTLLYQVNKHNAVMRISHRNNYNSHKHETTGNPFIPLIERKIIQPIAFSSLDFSGFNLLNDSVVNRKRNRHLPSCGKHPTVLIGYVMPQKTMNKTMTFAAMGMKSPELRPGGHYIPSTCIAHSKVAIIVPYRNREEHLKMFLNHMHPFLQRQELDYAIFVIEQNNGTHFNRAMLINIGWVEAIKVYDWECLIFHDVDLLPENDLNLYRCSKGNARHMHFYSDSFTNKKIYATYFGGVGQIPRHIFEKINGYSNSYWGWGGEDDDMYKRLTTYNYTIYNYPAYISGYQTLQHEKFSGGNDRNILRLNYKKKNLRHYRKNGLNSLQYNLLRIEYFHLYTLISVEITEPPGYFKAAMHHFSNKY